MVDLASRLRAAGCVFAEDEAAILESAAESPEHLERMAARRVDGEPLEYIVGYADFRGLRIAVATGVFVPRQRTGFLVECAIDRIRPSEVLLDLCCGAGAIGAAVAAAVPGIELHASDIDPIAVDCARANLPATASTYVGDLFSPLPAGLAGRIQVLTANVPYVPRDEIDMMPPEARLHERPSALDGGDDGLDVLRQVAASAPSWLRPCGHLLVETSEAQAPTAIEIMRSAGLTASAHESEDLFATVVIGTRGPAQT